MAGAKGRSVNHPVAVLRGDDRPPHNARAVHTVIIVSGALGTVSSLGAMVMVSSVWVEGFWNCSLTEWVGWTIPEARCQRVIGTLNRVVRMVVALTIPQFRRRLGESGGPSGAEG
jgi:hypothetical protein